MSELEYRSAALDANTEESKKMLVTGYAAVFNTPTVLFTDENGNEYTEVIKKGAFDNCDFKDTVFRYNHNDSYSILARTSNNTLVIEVDNIGLKITAEIANTTAGKDIFELIRRKDISKMSFGFYVQEDEYIGYTRYIHKIKKVVDVSAVDDPAYNATSITVLKRNICNAKKELDNYKQKVKILTLL